MKSTENNLISPELAIEMQVAVKNAAKGVRDPERIKRARASMDRIREDGGRQGPRLRGARGWR